MTVSFEETLSSVPAEDWQVQQAIVFDWHDGPREGLCELTRPECCFYFKAIEERAADDDLDDRFFRVAPTPPGSVKNALSILDALGLPSKPIWVPIWNFPTEEIRLKAERQLDDLVNGLEQAALIVRTPDMIHFLSTVPREALTSEPTPRLRAVG